MSSAVIDARGLTTHLGGAAVLRGVDLEVDRGEMVAIIGPSGGGKTTLLRALNYLTPFHAGAVQIAGQRLEPGLSERRDAGRLREVRRRVGMVFQHFHLFPHLDVIGNVMEAPRHVLGLEPTLCRQRAEALLERVGMAAQAHVYPHTLSGGQQQRAAIARALAMEPEVLLLDEPTSALDPQLVDEVLAVVGDLAAGGQTMLIVTHEMRFARRVAHRVVVLADGEVAETGSPEEVFLKPRSAAARGLLGSLRL
jgi:ABC-type polar amino acid transport system ATPase subunit